MVSARVQDARTLNANRTFYCDVKRVGQDQAGSAHTGEHPRAQLSSS